MMKLNLSLKNSIKPALLFISLLFPILLFGCSESIEASYKEKDIPKIIKKICKEEYKLDVSTQCTKTTLWIYIPLDKILHKDYGVKEDKIFDDEVTDKLRNIITTIGRVISSADNTPEFFALVASDIKLGIDYTLIGNVLDIKKSYADFIPWTEANRRYVIKLALSPESINDKTGFHFMPYDILMPDFLADQIAQRIGSNFQEEEMKPYFKVDKSEGKYINKNFYFDYSIAQIVKPKVRINIRKEILKTIAYCIKTYEFQDFVGVTLVDLLTKDTLNYSKQEILDEAKKI